MELTDEIERAFDATGLILVFVTVWFGLSVQAVHGELELGIPAGSHARKERRRKIMRTFLIHCAPLLAAYATTAYLFLPITTSIIEESEFSVWDFDFQRTAFVIVHFTLVLFLAYSVWLARRLGRKWLMTRPDE